MFRRSRGTKAAEKAENREDGHDPATADEIERPAPQPVLSEADAAVLADRLGEALSRLNESLGHEQLDIRAQLGALEERLVVLEHLIGQLVANGVVGPEHAPTGDRRGGPRGATRFQAADRPKRRAKSARRAKKAKRSARVATDELDGNETAAGPEREGAADPAEGAGAPEGA